MNHQWFNRLSKERQAEINKMFQEYKRAYNGTRKIRIAQITTESIKPIAEIELPEIEEDYIEIPVYDFTEKEYLEYKKKRNERAYKRFEVER